MFPVLLLPVLVADTAGESPEELQLLSIIYTTTKLKQSPSFFSIISFLWFFCCCFSARFGREIMEKTKLIEMFFLSFDFFIIKEKKQIGL